MEISIAGTDEEIGRCFSVVAELRPHLDAESFVSRVREQETAGYRIACVEVDGRVVAVAGYRVMEKLSEGRHVYVDDLVTLAGQRSMGYGSALLDWLAGQALAQGCSSVQLDSGVQREDAHRFYRREGMENSSLHFVKRLD